MEPLVQSDSCCKRRIPYGSRPGDPECNLAQLTVAWASRARATCECTCLRDYIDYVMYQETSAALFSCAEKLRLQVLRRTAVPSYNNMIKRFRVGTCMHTCTGLHSCETCCGHLNFSW
jgi:hypothetical protein